MKNIILFLLYIFISNSAAISEQHPCLFISEKEALEIKESLNIYPLFEKSFSNTQSQIDKILKQKIEIPPPGEAGGYEHEKHKQNYRDMKAAGVLFVITGEEKYARFVKDMLFAYSAMYPKLGPHPLSHKQAPGRLFHQTLNEAVWLVYTSIAYDCIYDWLSTEDRKKIENNIFQPMIELFTVEHSKQFNRIHNHGTWIVAGIGMLGYVINDKNLVEMALYGTKKDGNGGFLKQLDLLFSPDGYYMEGPYYARYALRPFYLFAEAIERNEPQRKIFEYRNKILGKAHYAAMQIVFPNGVFPPINDASRSMNVKSIGPIISNNIAFYRYGADENLLAIAAMQDNVILNKAGMEVARTMAKSIKSPELNWPSIEFRDGYDGKQGGLGILRSGSGKDQTMLLMKYGVHGLGHGHFDKLHFSFFNQGSEVIFDYGFARWVNIETKFGGRYLPENNSYAKQTIAHNTVVVDQISQNKAKRKQADKVSGERHFFNAGDKVQVMSAKSTEHYDGIEMQRTMLLVDRDGSGQPVVIDLFRINADDKHIYDYPIHFHGQLMASNLDYTAGLTEQKTLGDDFGYQHIWKSAQGNPDEPFVITWLHENRYYSLITSEGKGSRVFFGRSGANDPNFNLRSEPLIVVRREATDHLFAALIESHGFYSEAAEKSMQASPAITSVKVVGSNEQASVVEIKGKDLHWQVMVTNGPASDTKKHRVKFADSVYEWTGNYQFIDLKK